MNIYTHHIVYKTTNIVNDKIYIGVHSTNTLDDGYLGSGTELLRSIKKHGKEIFSREILFNFDTRQQAVDQEVELVTEAFVARADTYNLLPGGASSGSGVPGRAMRAGQEKENMTEFIAKKREMFLVQMSLDTKREEIRKLEEKAAMKEEALLKSEQMLEEDAVRFEALLG